MASRSSCRKVHYLPQDATTWGPPDALAQSSYTRHRGRTYQVHLAAWYDRLMRGKRDAPMHDQPFTLVRVRLLDAAGQPVFKRDLWLVVMGERRGELSLLEVQQAYGQRYDLEHFFRFGKQHLLLASFQTPDDAREVTWQQLVQVAYVQLYLARMAASSLPQPWQRYLPVRSAAAATPTIAQRDFARIIRQIGTPAAAPKRRGKSPGRAPGATLRRRPRHPVVKKARKQAKSG